MLLLKGGEIQSDSFRFLDDNEPLPEDVTIPVIVSWERLRADGDALSSGKRPVGVTFPVTEDPDKLSPYLDQLDLIALDFPAFTDGRAYSLARIIRTQLDFAGELRATGDVLPDQLAFMRQVGFDGFEIRSDRQSLDTWQKAATSISLTYQPGFVPTRGFAPAEIFEQRRQRA